MEFVLHYPWPGNVRELANLCAGLTVRARDGGHIAMQHVEHVWRRQHGGEEPPWNTAEGATVAPREHVAPQGRDRLGAWVLEQARAARFNLLEASRLLQRRKRAGQAVPLSERSTLTHYLTGEIVRALADARGDVAAAALALAADDELPPRLLPRVRKVLDTLREARARRAGTGAGTRALLGKLPDEYRGDLERARRLLGCALEA